MNITVNTKTINVGDVKIGDFVKSYSISNGKNRFNRINEIIPNEILSNEQVELTLENNDTLVVSKNTKVYVSDGSDNWEYLVVDELTKSKKTFFMMGDDHRPIMIKNIDIDNEFVSTNFIDFNVENDHNFYVRRYGDRNFKLIHNSGACTIALDTWHMDIEDFLELQTENGDQRVKAFDIFPQVVLSDEFMRRVVQNKPWTLFDPHEVKMKLDVNMAEAWGEEFERQYKRVERMVNKVARNTDVPIRTLVLDDFEDAYKKLLDNKGGLDDKRHLRLVKRVNARELFKTIMKTQVETGMPYFSFKDAINRANPNKHCGMIGNGNLCLSGESLVDVIFDGNKERIRMADLVDLYKTNKNILVKSINHQTNKVEYKRITNTFLTKKSSKVMKITDEYTGKFIVCTDEHKIWTENRGYVMAKDLEQTDKLKIITDHK